MSTSAVSSQGALIAISDVGCPFSFQNITEVSSINGPTGSAPIIDVTDLSSTGKEKQPGLMDEGQVTLEINYIPTNAVHELLRAVRASRELHLFRITFVGGTTFTFSAYVVGFSVTNAVDQVMKASVTLEITGAVTKA
jgi:predicted secreted protein